MKKSATQRLNKKPLIALAIIFLGAGIAYYTNTAIKTNESFNAKEAKVFSPIKAIYLNTLAAMNHIDNIQTSINLDNNMNKNFPKQQLGNWARTSYNNLNAIKNWVETSFKSMPHIKLHPCPRVVSIDPSIENKIWQLVDSAPINYGFNQTVTGATGSGPPNVTLTQIK